jgi:mRNA interferase RelE/StbE
MSTYELRWKPSARRDLEALGRVEARRVLRALEERLAADPRAGEPLRGSGRPMWRFRVGDYRVLYVFNDREVWILVLRVGHRGTVYERLP